jgi:hypothetical protein
MLAIMLLMVIFSASILGLYARDDAPLISATDGVKTQFRYVRQLAVSNDEHFWRIKIDSDKTGYALYKDSMPADSLPNEADNRHSLTEGITIAVRVGTQSVDTIGFDNWGQPFSEYEVTITDTKTGHFRRFRIREKSGFIDDA